ncbi:MAG: hypothetical protein ABI556_11555 [Gemmatimonadales bacterium]
MNRAHGLERAAVAGIAAAAFCIFVDPIASESVRAQTPAVLGTDSVTIAAGPSYAAGSFYRSLFGDDYREEWTMPIRVPVLDLKTFAGGLTPTKLGGGRQTRSLRLSTPDSSEFVFRPIYKAQTILPDQFKHTIIWTVFQDQGAASHPGGAVAAAPILQAADILHPTGRIAVMPDDPRLGEYRKEFAGKLGEIEEYPHVPEKGHAFADAKKILDGEELLEKINASPSDRVDARTLLRARLIDMLLNDNDRHPDQWKWARLSGDSSFLWEPIPRDRDKVFLQYEGALLHIGRKFAPSLVEFDSRYPKGSALFENAMEFDRRLLGGLDKSVWDAEAIALKQRITDDVIVRSVRSMPPEYTQLTGDIVAKLRSRRDFLSEAASQYYSELWEIAEIHGTDAADDAVVARAPDGSVTIRLGSGGSAPYFIRRFDPEETKEIRVYMHGGDDNATVTGSGPSRIGVKVIGGNGTNFAGAGKEVNEVKFYDVGIVSGVKYDKDTVMEKTDPASELNARYNRRPWIRAYGTLLPPQKDRGVRIEPVLGARTGHGIGLTPKVGIARTAYAFRYVPYASKVQADLSYSFVHSGYAVNLFGDKRFESSQIHVPVDAGVSQLDMVVFRGFGNNLPEREEKFYDIKQTAWRFRPAGGFSFNAESGLTFGPIVRYTKTDSVSNRFISQQRPYGFTTFAEAGALVKLHYDTRYKPDTLRPRAILDLSASGYPGMLDAKTAYESVEGAVTAYINIPVGTRPVIALRGGGKKVYGNFPYFDAAFLGGGSTLRTEHRQSIAGDASVFGAGELRVPVAKFPLIFPLDVGLIGFTEAGRVYVDGESPGGWHTATGGGFWIGLIDPGKSINVLFTNKKTRRTMVSLGFAY